MLPVVVHEEGGTGDVLHFGADVEGRLDGVLEDEIMSHKEAEALGGPCRVLRDPAKLTFMAEALFALAAQHARQDRRALRTEVVLVLCTERGLQTIGMHQTTEGSIDRTRGLVVGEARKLAVVALEIDAGPGDELARRVAGPLDVFVDRARHRVLLVVVGIGREGQRRSRAHR